MIMNDVRAQPLNEGEPIMAMSPKAKILSARLRELGLPRGYFRVTTTRIPAGGRDTDNRKKMQPGPAVATFAQAFAQDWVRANARHLVASHFTVTIKVWQLCRHLESITVSTAWTDEEGPLELVALGACADCTQARDLERRAGQVVTFQRVDAPATWDTLRWDVKPSASIGLEIVREGETWVMRPKDERLQVPLLTTTRPVTPGDHRGDVEALLRERFAEADELREHAVSMGHALLFPHG